MDGDENRLYILKLLRIANGLSLLDPTKTYEIITLYNQKRIKDIIDHNEKLANSTDSDQIYMRYLMIFKYFLRTFKLVFIIWSVSYFLGVIWFIGSFEFYHHWETDFDQLDPKIYNTETFITTFDLDPHTS